MARLKTTSATSKATKYQWSKYGGSWLALACLLMLPDLITALSNIKINVPRAVKRGGNANLICNYDMEEARLYSVKWYKGKKEFFRFMPNEVPNVKVFSHSNLKVETMLSNQTHLLLQDMQPENSGKYTCEISMDAPDFTTAMITGELEVVELPKEQAIVTGIHPRYRIGDLVDGNCSIKFSKPAANLTWTINGIVVPPHHIKTYQIEKHENSSLESVMSALNFMATTQHFIKGQMRLKCTASLFDIFKEEIESIIEEDRPRIMASGQSYDMHNYPYEQSHTGGDGFEDQNESYLTHYYAADTKSGSSSAFTSSFSIIQKLKSHFQRIGLKKLLALARKAQRELTNGFAPLRTSTKMLSSQAVQEQTLTAAHEKTRSQSALHSLATVCYCIAAFAIILTHHFMSCQNTKTTTKAAVATVACLSATKSTSLSSTRSCSSSNKSLYNCPEKSVKARKFPLHKWQTSMAVQRRQSDCQYDDDDDNINDDCQRAHQPQHQRYQRQQQQQQLSLQLHLQLKEHIQVQHQRMLWTLLLPASIESSESLRGVSDNNCLITARLPDTVTQNSLSLSKDQTLLMIVTQHSLLILLLQRLRLLFHMPTHACDETSNSKVTRKTSTISSFTFFPNFLQAPLARSSSVSSFCSSSLFHHNQRQLEYC